MEEIHELRIICENPEEARFLYDILEEFVQKVDGASTAQYAFADELKGQIREILRIWQQD